MSLAYRHGDFPSRSPHAISQSNSNPSPKILRTSAWALLLLQCSHVGDLAIRAAQSSISACGAQPEVHRGAPAREVKRGLGRCQQHRSRLLALQLDEAPQETAAGARQVPGGGRPTCTSRRVACVVGVRVWSLKCRRVTAGDSSQRGSKQAREVLAATFRRRTAPTSTQYVFGSQSVELLEHCRCRMGELKRKPVLATHPAARRVVMCGHFRHGHAFAAHESRHLDVFIPVATTASAGDS